MQLSLYCTAWTRTICASSTRPSMKAGTTNRVSQPSLTTIDSLRRSPRRWVHDLQAGACHQQERRDSRRGACRLLAEPPRLDAGAADTCDLERLLQPRRVYSA